MSETLFQQLQGAVTASPADDGALALIVRRPAKGQREIVATAELSEIEGLVGDSWRNRRSSRTPDGSPHPGMQLTLINARVIELLAGGRDRWPLAGDQLYVDLDLSVANLPPGTCLAIGAALVEVSREPHTGCGDFVARFGRDAMEAVNSPRGRQLNLRGINATVVRPGTIRVGDAVRKLEAARPYRTPCTL